MLESSTEEQTQLSTEMVADPLVEARAVCQCESLPELVEVHKKIFQKCQEKRLSL